ncbi:hypothetical protein LSAT2_012101 [Lamellibrachia satsuma]|nr:hypothetical protein LSAT2_012101 [Lamellibrachia satsuma]
MTISDVTSHCPTSVGDKLSLAWCVLVVAPPVLLLLAVVTYETTKTRADTQSCAVGYFPCGNLTSTCVAQELHCDGVEHCPNGADEAYENCQDNEGYFTFFGNTHVMGPPIQWDVCELAHVPDNCRCFGSTRLNCVDRGLRQLPHGIPYNVTRLLLRNNSIGEIRPGCLTSFKSLHLLHLEHNVIRSMSAGAFDGAYNLTKLFLENNHLRTIAKGAFGGLTDLTVLQLQHNELTLSEPYTTLPNSAIIELNNNKIEVITCLTFAGSADVTILVLRLSEVFSLAASHVTAATTASLAATVAEAAASAVDAAATAAAAAAAAAPAEPGTSTTEEHWCSSLQLIAKSQVHLLPLVQVLPLHPHGESL